jgi:Na+-driven multidrug efflux pump
MVHDGKPTDLGRIFRFWIPMAGTWLMMALEAPFLAAVIARLDDPKQNLAAFGVAFSVAILVEAPVIMILSASTALVEGPVSYRMLRRFTYVLNLALTAVMLAMLVTPLWRSFAAHAIGLPPEVVELTQWALLLMVPWPAAIGYRRFYHGLLIRHGLTRLVAYGTATRLLTMALTSLFLFAMTQLPGALVGAAALTAGVSVEAVVSRIMVHRVVRAVVSVTDEPPTATTLTYRRIFVFYTPLALTSLIGLAVHPAVAFFMGHASFALESLAVLPVVNSLSFVFRSLGLSYQEVAIALLAQDDRNTAPTARFAILLAAASSAAMALIAFTPLAWIWYHDVSGLSHELTLFTLMPTRILTVLPALSVLLSLQRAILVNDRATAPITWSTVVEVGGIVATLLLCIGGLNLVGVTAAAIGFVVGRLGGNLYLAPPCAKAMRREVSAAPAE